MDSFSTPVGRAEPFTAPERTVVPGGCFVRLLAGIIDSAIVQVPLALVFVLIVGAGVGALGWDAAQVDRVSNIGQLVGWFIALPYFAWFYKHKGATPGKMIFGLKVVDVETGANVGYGRAVFRETIGKIVSAMILGIGFIMMLFRRDKRGLHDLLSRTEVVRIR
jgi:uncharacterized RDD family membrane protein YckC